MAPTYEKVAQAFANEENCIVANLDATAQADIAQRYDIGGYPTLKMFPAGDDKKPVEYDGGRAMESFVAYLNQKCGTKRNADGTLADDAGHLPPLVSAAKKFADAGDKTTAASELKAAAKKVDKSLPYAARATEYYVKVADKIVSKGAEYPAGEIARLERLLEKGGDSMQGTKVSIVCSFFVDFSG